MVCILLFNPTATVYVLLASGFLYVYSNISMHHTLSPSLDSIANSLDSVGSLGEFGEPGPDPAKFIEDGSFIGEYSF